MGTFVDARNVLNHKWVCGRRKTFTAFTVKQSIKTVSCQNVRGQADKKVSMMKLTEKKN